MYQTAAHQTCAFQKMARFQFVLRDALQSACTVLQNKGRSLGLLADLVIKLGSSHRGYFVSGHKLSDPVKPVLHKPN